VYSRLLRRGEDDAALKPRSRPEGEKDAVERDIDESVMSVLFVSSCMFSRQCADLYLPRLACPHRQMPL
jgi:hypothetical protein